MHTRSRACGCLVFVGSLVFALVGASSAQTITEFALPTPAAGAKGISSGDDGGVWFTEHEADRIGRINPDGTIREISLPPGSAPGGITAGFGGRVWFTEEAGNRIGRINFDGTLSEFDVPTPDSTPSDIAFGPDGSFWFTETATNKIGRVDPN